MKLKVVVVAIPAMCDEVLTSLWTLVRVQITVYLAHASVDHDSVRQITLFALFLKYWLVYSFVVHVSTLIRV